MAATAAAKVAEVREITRYGKEMLKSRLHEKLVLMNSFKSKVPTAKSCAMFMDGTTIKKSPH